MRENDANAQQEDKREMEENKQVPLQKDNCPEFEQLGGPVFAIWGDIDLRLFEIALAFAKKNKGIKKLNLIIQSDGGDAHVGFMSAKVLQSCCENMTAYIPRWAKSASTLICLAAHEIVLSLGAQIGPLDTQVPDPQNEEYFISALNGFTVLRAIADFLHLELDLTVRQINKQARLTATQAIHSSTEFVDIIAHPLLEKVRVQDLGFFKRALDTILEYGIELLRQANVKEEKAKKIANKLVYGYPNHAFAINFHQASGIGLHAREPSDDENNIIEYLYDYLNNEVKEGQCYYGAITKS